MQSGESQPVSRLNSPDGVDSEISQPDAFTEAILEAAGPAVDTSVGHTKMYLELVSDSAADFITRRQQNEGLTFLDAFSLGGGKTQRDIFDCVEEVCTELLPGEHPREQTAHNMAIFDAYADMLAEEKTKVVPVFGPPRTPPRRHPRAHAADPSHAMRRLRCGSLVVITITVMRYLFEDPWEASSFTPVTKIKQRQLQQQQHDASAAAVGAAEVNRLVVERLERASKWNLGAIYENRLPWSRCSRLVIYASGAEAFDEFAVGEAAAPGG